VRAEALKDDDRLPVQEIMEAGPATIRADEDLAALVERMQRRRVSTIIVTDPDGRLIGILRRDDGEQAIDTHTRATYLPDRSVQLTFWRDERSGAGRAERAIWRGPLRHLRDAARHLSDTPGTLC
jgi:hypothetical protein